MKIKLIGFLDFFLFKKNLKKHFNITFFQYGISFFMGKYIFFVINETNKAMLLKAQNYDNDKFEILKVLKTSNLDKKIIESLVFDEFKNSQFIYITDKYDKKMDYLGFKERQCEVFMKINLKNIEFDKSIFSDFEFEKLDSTKNADKRCEIQNEAFYSESRMPIKIKDIKYEMKRKCFVEELSYFLKFKKIYIAYGQIMILDGNYTIANLCVKNDFQCNGYGKILIKYLMFSAKNLNIENLYIKVDNENIKAFNLYKKLGFETINQTCIYTL